MARNPFAAPRYNVQPGDTLPAVSMKMYGSPHHWPIIYNANIHLLDSPETKLKPGMVLHIP